MLSKALFVYIAVLFCFSAFSGAYAQTVVVVNKDNPINNLSLSSLKKIYLGRVTSFEGGGGIVLLAYTPLRESFYKQTLGKTFKQVKFS